MLSQETLIEKPDVCLQYLAELEEAGNEVLDDRREIIDLDKKRQANREGLRALEKHSSKKKIWLYAGCMLIKLPSTEAQDWIEKEQVEVNTKINKLRSDLKVKVNKLRDLEHLPPVTGTNLSPLTHQEISAVKQLMGVKSL